MCVYMYIYIYMYIYTHIHMYHVFFIHSSIVEYLGSFHILAIVNDAIVNNCCSVTKSSLTLQPHGLQHARLPCFSLFPRVCSDSCPLSWWCHPTISSSVAPFSSYPQSFPESGSFPMFSFSNQVANVLELQLQHQSFQWIFRVDFL